ncbi:retrotransposon protein, putative, ty1-copia subclass [Tanacetum coccineum]
MNGKVYTFKARLVAKGYTQTYGVDYGKTFSPVADIRAIRILLAISAFYDYEIWQMDVKIAFLNGHLSEDVYMVQPKGFVDPTHPNKKLKLCFVSVFFIKDLGEAAYILGIKIIRDRSKRLIAFSKSAYLEKTLNKFRMENSKKGYTPMIEKPGYRKSQGAQTPSEVQHMRSPYASDKDDTKSQTGYVFVLNGGTVDWKSANQSTTAMSSTEAEYIAAAEASMEAV